MKIFYTLFFAFCGLVLSAQISHSPELLKIDSPTPIDSATDTRLDIYFNVEKDTTYTVYWKVIKDPTTWNDAWATYVCDKILCYNENVDKNIFENEMTQGKHLFQFHFKPYAVPGCTVLEFVLYGDSRFSEEIYRVKIDVNGCIQTDDITHSPDQLKINTPEVIDSLTDVKVDINFTINKDTTYTVYWKVEKDPATWNNAWATRVCDLFTCFGDNVDRGPFENVMGKGNYLFQLHFLPYAVPGCTVVDLVLYGDSRYSEELYRVTVDINDCLVSSVDNVKNLSDVRVFPNPAHEYFQLSGDVNVSQIKMYDILGQEVKTFAHQSNTQHTIGDLKSGMYFLNLLDAKNKVIKTLKINKVY